MSIKNITLSPYYVKLICYSYGCLPNNKETVLECLKNFSEFSNLNGGILPQDYFKNVIEFKKPYFNFKPPKGIA